MFNKYRTTSCTLYEINCFSEIGCLVKCALFLQYYIGTGSVSVARVVSWAVIVY